MKAILVGIVILAIEGWSVNALAFPILSDDGSLLTGLDVNGTLYNVRFGDGVVGEVYKDAVFDDVRRVEAISISNALIRSFTEMGTVALHSISGCEKGATWGGEFSCRLFLPNIKGTGSLSALLAASDIGVGIGGLGFTWTPGGWVEVPPEWEIESSGHWLGLSYDSATQGAITLVTYGQASAMVPSPSPLLLMILGLLIHWLTAQENFRERSSFARLSWRSRIRPLSGKSAYLPKS